jgi:hypothetical protein
MLLVNFSGQPIGTELLRSLAALTGMPVEEARNVAVPATLPVGDFEDGIAQLVEAIGYTQVQLQTCPVVVIPPRRGAGAAAFRYAEEVPPQADRHIHRSDAGCDSSAPEYL